MKTKFVEAMHPEGTGNWGKFMVGKFEEHEWHRESIVLTGWVSSREGHLATALLISRGWHPDHHIFVMDLQTGEGAMFMPGGIAKADLNKHKIWVCPLFEPFLTWLYKQDLTDLDKLPSKIEFTHEEAPCDYAGYRRPGE